MNDLESQLYYRRLSPKEVAQQVLKATCQFYDADWCGLIQVDLDLNLWTPFWWFNTGATDKTMLLTEEYESAEFLDRWVQAVRKGIPMVVPDAEVTKEAYPAEYDLYQRLGIRSVIAVSLEPRPVALLAVRNPKRYIQQTSMLRILAYVLLASYNEQKMLNRLQMANIPTSIQNSKDIYVSLFGELSISTSKGVLKEADFNSPRISRLISYLLISRKNAISPQEITQTLWPDDSDNPAKNVKGLVYRLRQKFSIISDEPLVLSSASGYQLNPELHIMTDYQRFDELVSSAVRASSVINKVDILKNALDLYHGKVLSSADGEHWLIQFATKYHLSYMSAVSELLKQLDSLHSYDLLNQYAMKSLTIAPDNPKAYCWLIRSLKAQGMNELATNELAAAKEHLTTEEYEEILAFGVNW
ncbi:transcriptional regulator [Faecalibacterium prausnitzii]|nr:winged helix-turn-helix domain-containing protein [Faecalibacterium prausnitzii]RHC42631.1 transcriptional regulator [Faecalibacterium prausnitzii]